MFLVQNELPRFLGSGAAFVEPECRQVFAVTVGGHAASLSAAGAPYTSRPWRNWCSALFLRFFLFEFYA